MQIHIGSIYVHANIHRIRFTTVQYSVIMGSFGINSEIEGGYILTCQAHPLSDDVDLVFE